MLKGKEDRNAAWANMTLLGFLTVLNVLNMVDRNLIASLSPYIVADLELSNTEYGLLTGFVFLIFYSVMGLFMGALADNVNRVKLIAGALAVWSALTALSGLARGFVSIAVPRAFIAIGESAMAPSALSLLADRFPRKNLGFACSIYYLGIPLGVSLSYFVAGVLAPEIGWRACFYLLGGIGLALALVTLLFKDDYRRPKTVESAEHRLGFSFRETFHQVLLALKAYPPLLFLIIGSFVSGLFTGAISFDQLWLVGERSFARAEIAQITGRYAIVFGVLGTLFGAFGADYCMRRFSLARIRFVFVVVLLLTPLGIIYRIADPGSLWFWAGFASIHFWLGATVGPFFAVVQEFSPAKVRGTMIAFSMLLTNIIGLGLGNFAIGIAVDYLAAAGSKAPYSTALLVNACVASTCVVFYYLADRGAHKRPQF